MKSESLGFILKGIRGIVILYFTGSNVICEIKAVSFQLQFNSSKIALFPNFSLKNTHIIFLISVLLKHRAVSSLALVIQVLKEIINIPGFEFPNLGFSQCSTIELRPQNVRAPGH